MKMKPGIYRLLRNRLVSDAIVNILPPADVHRFVKAANLEFLSNEELNRYMNPFKTVIPSRKWLNTKVNNGYVLIRISTEMKAILDPCGMERIGKRASASLVLIMTDGEYLVPLDEAPGVSESGLCVTNLIYGFELAQEGSTSR